MSRQSHSSVYQCYCYCHKHATDSRGNYNGFKNSTESSADEDECRGYRQSRSGVNCKVHGEAFELDEETWQDLSSLREKACKFIRSESETSSEATWHPCQYPRENIRNNNLVKKASDLIDYVPASEFLKKIKHECQYWDKAPSVQNVLPTFPEANTYDPYMCQKYNTNSRQIINAGGQFDNGKCKPTYAPNPADEPPKNFRGCMCGGRQQLQPQPQHQQQPKSFERNRNYNAGQNDYYDNLNLHQFKYHNGSVQALNYQRVCQEIPNDEKPEKPEKKSEHISRSKKPIKTRGRRKPRSTSTEKSESQVHVEANLKKPHENSCERCWRYASPARSPVNKPEQRYDPNFRRAHSCMDFKSERGDEENIDAAGKQVSPCKNVQPLVNKNFVPMPEVKQSTTKVKELLSDLPQYPQPVGKTRAFDDQTKSRGLIQSDSRWKPRPKSCTPGMPSAANPFSNFIEDLDVTEYTEIHIRPRKPCVELNGPCTRSPASKPCGRGPTTEVQNFRENGFKCPGASDRPNLSGDKKSFKEKEKDGKGGGADVSFRSKKSAFEMSGHQRSTGILGLEQKGKSGRPETAGGRLGQQQKNDSSKSDQQRKKGRQGNDTEDWEGTEYGELPSSGKKSKSPKKSANESAKSKQTSTTKSSPRTRESDRKTGKLSSKSPRSGPSDKSSPNRTQSSLAFKEPCPQYVMDGPTSNGEGVRPNTVPSYFIDCAEGEIPDVYPHPIRECDCPPRIPVYKPGEYLLPEGQTKGHVLCCHCRWHEAAGGQTNNRCGGQCGRMSQERSPRSPHHAGRTPAPCQLNHSQRAHSQAHQSPRGPPPTGGGFMRRNFNENQYENNIENDYECEPPYGIPDNTYTISRTERVVRCPYKNCFGERSPLKSHNGPENPMQRSERCNSSTKYGAAAAADYSYAPVERRYSPRGTGSGYSPTKYSVFYMTKCKEEKGDDVEVLVEELTQTNSSKKDAKTEDVAAKMKRVLECNSDSMALRFQKGISESSKNSKRNRVLYF